MDSLPLAKYTEISILKNNGWKLFQHTEYVKICKKERSFARTAHDYYPDSLLWKLVKEKDYAFILPF